jgi:hypothetical protein
METKYLNEEINYLESLQMRDELTDNEDNKLIEFRMIKGLLSELKKLRVADVMRSCNHENKTNYCNTDGSYSHKVCDDCNETLWD